MIKFGNNGDYLSRGRDFFVGQILLLRHAKLLQRREVPHNHGSMKNNSIPEEMTREGTLLL